MGLAVVETVQIDFGDCLSGKQGTAYGVAVADALSRCHHIRADSIVIVSEPGACTSDSCCDFIGDHQPAGGSDLFDDPFDYGDRWKSNQSG